MKKMINVMTMAVLGSMLLPMAASAAPLSNPLLPQSTFEQCLAAYRQAPAYRTCVETDITGHPDDSCTINAYCSTMDGGEKHNRYRVPITSVPRLHNCNGTFGVGGC